MINKEEYETMMKLLDKGEINRVKEYLYGRMEYKYLSAARNEILKLINNDCIRAGISYFRRVYSHDGVSKLYRGFYNETEEGFTICHKGSNVFKINDKSILTVNLTKMLEGSYFFETKENREDKAKLLDEFFENLHEDELKPIDFVTKLKENMTLYTEDETRIAIPSNYYRAAHNILGEDTQEYAYRDRGIYFNSPKGKVMIMGIKNIY